jgi:hypothetical protein
MVTPRNALSLRRVRSRTVSTSEESVCSSGRTCYLVEWNRTQSIGSSGVEQIVFRPYTHSHPREGNQSWEEVCEKPWVRYVLTVEFAHTWALYTRIYPNVTRSCGKVSHPLQNLLQVTDTQWTGRECEDASEHGNGSSRLHRRCVVPGSHGERQVASGRPGDMKCCF